MYSQDIPKDSAPDCSRLRPGPFLFCSFGQLQRQRSTKWFIRDHRDHLALCITNAVVTGPLLAPDSSLSHHLNYQPRTPTFLHTVVPPGTGR